MYIVEIIFIISLSKKQKTMYIVEIIFIISLSKKQKTMSNFK